MQNKKRSLSEAVFNTIIGYVITLCCSPFLYSICGIEYRTSQLCMVTLLFTLLSILRGYVIRRWFNRKDSFSLELLSKRISDSSNLLTPQYLLDRGWVFSGGFYFEPNIKGRDRISISFEGHFYRVWHSEKMTFIACESTVEWFELYFFIIHPENRK